MKSLKTKINEASQTELLLHIPNDEVVKLLTIALAEEYNAWFQYYVVIPFAYGPERTAICDVFKEHAKDELEDHAAWLLERINQLGGMPIAIMNPEYWNKLAVHKFIQPMPDYNVKDLLAQNIEAEKGAIETYNNLEILTRDKDIVTHTKVKEILADEQEHLQNLQDLLKDIS